MITNPTVAFREALCVLLENGKPLRDRRVNVAIPQVFHCHNLPRQFDALLRHAPQRSPVMPEDAGLPPFYSHCSPPEAKCQPTFA